MVLCNLLFWVLWYLFIKIIYFFKIGCFFKFFKLLLLNLWISELIKNFLFLNSMFNKFFLLFV